MNKALLYKILYYLIFIATIFIWISTSRVINSYGVVETPVNLFLAFANLILVIIFSIKIMKNKLKSINILFPIIHISFMIVVIVFTLIMNNKLIIPYIHFTYYTSFILFNYLLLNLYSNLSLVKNKI